MDVQLVLKISRHIAVITEEPRETTFSFQRLFIAPQKGNAVSFQNTITTEFVVAAVITLFINFRACSFVLADLIRLTTTRRLPSNLRQV